MDFRQGLFLPVQRIPMTAPLKVSAPPAKSHPQNIAPAAADHVVKDIGLAEWGRKEIAVAEIEMPGLMATREEYGPEEALRGARIPGSPNAPQAHAAAATAASGIPVFAVKGESLEDYWEYTHRIFEWGDGGAPNLILDDGGDATLLIHLGLRSGQGETGPISKPTNEEEEVLFAAIKRRLGDKPGWYRKNAETIRGVSEETTTGVHRLYEMQKKGTLLWPA